jgi:hypothetical protein
MILYLVATKGNSFEKIKKNVSGAAGIDNWSGEYSYICVHRPYKQLISKE